MLKLTGVIAVAAAVFGGSWTGAGPARADEAETERRLKRIGVSKALRDDVRAAIGRGVAHLAATQRKDGLWVDPDAVEQMDIEQGDGLNALCALALLHADTALARASAERAVATLFPEGGSTRPQLVQTVYGAGLALLILDATHGDRERAAYIASRLAEGRHPKSGTWTLRTGPPPTFGIHAPTQAPKMSGPLNLSTSQFAVLGLHAAARMGAMSDLAVWGDVLDGLLHGQQLDGSWTHSPHHPEMNNTYPTGTFMGVANLWLAARHLRVDEDESRGTSRKRRVASAIEAARVALEADGVLTLWAARRACGSLDGDWYASHGHGALNGYSLWSLEKACVFLGIERLDGVPWYADVARTLCDVQRPDGSWCGVPAAALQSDLLSTTSFALLILVRDMESLREETPRDAPQDPAVTPSPGDANAKAPAAAQTAVPIDVAAAALAKFRGLIAAPKTTNRDLIEPFDLFERARADLAPPADPLAPAVDPLVLLRAIDDAAVDALFLAGEDPAGDEEGRAPVNRRAAEFLAAAPAATLADVRSRADALFRDRKAHDGPFALTPYRPALALLASRGGADVFEWMLDVALSDELIGERGERSLAMLLAVPRFRSLPGSLRLDAAKSIANQFVGREAASIAVPTITPGADPRNRMRWSRFRPRVVEAILALATDPATGVEPRDRNGRPLLEVTTLADWLRDHDDRRRPPWR